MEQKFLGWSIAEINHLLHLIHRKQSHSLHSVFVEHSQHYSRSVHTVRNFYYKLKKTYPSRISPQNQHHQSNILTMPPPSQPTLSDSEINSLFRGLVQLVKNNIQAPLQKEVNFFSSALQKSIVEIRKKDTIIRDLTEQNTVIAQQLNHKKNQLNQTQKTNQNTLRTICSLANSNKMQKLREFLLQITQNTNMVSKE